jgi:hypothetical protein
VVGSKATRRASGSSIVLATGSVMVDDMTVHEHAAGQIVQANCLTLQQLNGGNCAKVYS